MTIIAPKSSLGKCLGCLSEYFAYQVMQKKGQVPAGTGEPVVEDAITMAPQWQSKTIMGQMIMACVAVPTCYRHLVDVEATAEEKAIMNGKIIPAKAGLAE